MPAFSVGRMQVLVSFVRSRVRGMRRWIRPKGVFLVVLGPDGVGKTTCIRYLINNTQSIFRGHDVFHWRPMLLWRRRSSGRVTDPHGQSPHSAWWSIARVFSHTLDYWLGYWLKIRPLLARSHLVIFDRYFYDLKIDPRRYRYAGPQWLLSVLNPLVPKPDVVLFLDAPEEVILSRKQEVQPIEVRRQRQSYRQLAGATANAELIRTDEEIHKTFLRMSQVLAKILMRHSDPRHSACIATFRDSDREVNLQ